MARMTNNLFESITKVMTGEKPEETQVKEGQVDKAHYCATHVEHAVFGEGECIAEAHAEPDADGNIAWYTVQFKDGARKVYTEAMKVKKAKMHEHADLSDEELEQVDEAQTSAAARLAKAKMKSSHQAATTMKHISNPTAGEKKAAKDIKPGIAGYRDRVAMLKSAEARGGLKAEGMDPVGKEDEDIDNDGDKDKSDSYLHNRRKAIKAAMKEEIEVKYYIEESIKVEIPTDPTYADYLDAVKTIVNSDDDEVQQEIIAIAEEAFLNKEIDIIIEAAVSKMQQKDVKNKMKYYFGDFKPTVKPETSKKMSGARHDIEVKGGVTKATARIKDNEGQGTTAAERRTMKRIASRTNK